MTVLTVSLREEAKAALPRTAEMVFTYAGNIGPIVKRFTSETAFDGYCTFWRDHVGPVQFVAPNVAQASL